MNSANTNRLQRHPATRRLPVRWLERPEAAAMSPTPVYMDCRTNVRPVCPPKAVRPWRGFRAFTLLEMMIVIAIIGLLTYMALPHLGGMTKASAMTTATRQLLDDVAFARQRALINRSEVDMVFLPPTFWINTSNGYMNLQSSNLIPHQFAAYALISTRTVGDQPGKSYPHYLTDWRYLPQGVFFGLFSLTNPPASLTITTTNTTIGVSNVMTVAPLPWGTFPFPSTYNSTNANLPYLAIAVSGQLKTNGDQYILLNTGSILCPMNPDGTYQMNAPSWIETPGGNVSNNPNVIHIDWVTARAKIEHNQF